MTLRGLLHEINQYSSFDVPTPLRHKLSSLLLHRFLLPGIKQLCKTFFVFVCTTNAKT
jgi:hypothetical protein